MVWVWVVLLAVLSLWVGWRLLLRSFVRQYFTKNYAPIQLSESQLGYFPPNHHLQDVPWCSTRETYCQANTLQMITHQQGRTASRDEINFLMGFTYGASALPKIGFSPFTDPEPGHAVAAPYLGLVRHYYVTHDPKLYLRALRFYLSRGHPLHVPLDYAVLYGLRGFIPHSNLLVGYDQNGFYYYETVAMQGSSLEPGFRAPGEQGLWVSNEKLLEAALSQSRHFKQPWRYAFALFEPWPTQSDLKLVWRRNARLLMGGEKYGPKQGADAIAQTANQIQKHWHSINPQEMCLFLDSAAYTRRDNADFLRTHFAEEEGILRAANLLEQAAQLYRSVQKTIRKGLHSQAEANQVAAWLNEASSAEWEVGSIFARVAHTSKQPAPQTDDIEKTQP